MHGGATGTSEAPSGPNPDLGGPDKKGETPARIRQTGA